MAVTTAPVAAKTAPSKDGKAKGKSVTFINDHALAILIVLLAVLAVVVALQVV